ncbi:hypothetical protein AEP_01594 [Curvibacter sp. AEP1-3]|uniref:hypothetical protein n=1 Tax=Curvibacter sp. AEP1-3 TaxID=1844971 RepID=UPI000B3CB828|nr:hypothetical protein [Curvibacter sp. AEP1-3]ARV18538.1 hypothetical protein AEP_01594 [Curvibacter sp. AEP1-3]
MAEGKVGRKEILTKELGLRICKMIEQMPDHRIPVTWENVSTLSKKRFGHGFNRQMLSQKTWDDRKLIAEAFSEAKNVQRRMRNDDAPKYKTSSRTVLQKRITDLELANMAMKEELEKVRSQQMSQLDAFLTTRLDLRKLLEDSMKDD